MNAALSAILNGVLLGLALTAALSLLMRVTPRRLVNAATRYVVWWAALALTICAPMFYLPRSHPRPIVRPVAAPPIPSTAIPRPQPVETARAPIVLRMPAANASPIQIRIGAPKWPRYLAATWALLSLTLLTRLIRSFILLDRLTRRAAAVPPRNWAMRVGAARRRITVARSSEISTPVAVGPWRPTILLPDRLLAELNADELDQVGLHEAAHLARFDDCALLIQRIIESLFAPHPAVFWIARQIDLEREIACDDKVIAARGEPRSYARCLTRVVELSGPARSSIAASGAAESYSQLTCRVEALLQKARHGAKQPIRIGVFAAVLIIAALTWAGSRAPRLVAFAMALPQASQTPPVQRTPASPPTTSQTEAQTLEGSVIEDSTKNPLPSVELRFHQAGKIELAADLDTDRAGRFNAAELPAGEYTVDVVKPNYITTTVKMRAPATGLTIPLIRYAVIDGHVTDSTGNPQPGQIHAYDGRTEGSARIAIMVKTAGSPELRHLRNADVDENGHYRIYDLTPGQYAIGLWYTGVKDGSGMQLYPDTGHPKIFSVVGGEDYEGIDFTTTPHVSFAVSGKIDLPDSKQQFQLVLSMPEQPALPIAQAVTQPDGTFRLDKVPSGTYDLFVSGPLYSRTPYDWTVRDEALFGRTQIQVVGQNLEGVTVPLTPSRSVNVQFVARDSKRPAGCPQSAPVSITAIEPWGLPFSSSRTQVSFEKPTTIRNLPPARIRVAAYELGSGCFQVKDEEVNLNATPPDPMMIDVAPAGSIHGTTKASSSVELRNQDSPDDAQPRLVYPDAQGRFAFDGLRPGHYRVSQSAFAVGVEVRPGAASAVDLGAHQ